MKINISFLSWIGKAPLAVEIPNDTGEQLRLRVALELSVKTNANLAGARLSYANLNGANLNRANFYGANLYGKNRGRAGDLLARHRALSIHALADAGR